MGVAVEVLVLGEGREAAVHEALSAAERNSSWVIIDKLHLGTPKFLRDLRLQLQRIHKARGEWMSWREKNYFLHIYSRHVLNASFLVQYFVEYILWLLDLFFYIFKSTLILHGFAIKKLRNPNLIAWLFLITNIFFNISDKISSSQNMLWYCLISFSIVYERTLLPKSLAFMLNLGNYKT